jgi:plasmid stabilization system protein ParE
LAEAAEDDLKGIAQYTVTKWGPEQATGYGTQLEIHFQAIGNGKAKSRIFLPRRPELRVSRVEHHYVFHLERENQNPLILAVFHENMDLMTRLRNQLEG